MPRLSKVFRASFESQQQELPATPVVSDPVIDHAVDLAEQQSKFEKASDDFETLSDIAEALESIAVAMEGMRDTGLSPQAAFYMNLAVDGLSKRAGYEQPATLGLESFVGPLARVSTTISLEGVQERVKQVMEQLLKLWDQIKKAFQAFMKSILDGVHMLRGKVDNLIEQARKFGTNSELIDLHSSAKLSINGKVPEGLAGLHITLAVAEDVLSYGIAHNTEVDLLQKTIAKGAAAKSDGEFEAAMQDLLRFTNPIPRCFKHSVAGEHGTKAYSTDMFCGEARYVLSEKQGAEYIDREYSNDPVRRALMQIGDHSVTLQVDLTKAASPGKVRPLTVGEVEEIDKAMSALEELCEKNWKAEHAESNFDHDLRNAISAGKYNHLSPKNQSDFVYLLHTSSDQLRQRARLRGWLLSNAVNVTREYALLGARSLARNAKATPA